MLLFVSSVATCVAVLAFLPTDPTTQASFGTWPAQLAYLKSVFYAWMVGPIFLFLPFHFVVVMQRELFDGKADQVAAILSGDNLAVLPAGTHYPPVWALAAYLAGLFLLNYAAARAIAAVAIPQCEPQRG